VVLVLEYLGPRLTYRDERDALRGRIAELEGELASAKQTVRRLKGEVPPPKPISTPDARIAIDREVPVSITDQGYTAIAALLPRRLGAIGQMSKVDNHLTYRLPGVQVDVDGTTPGRTSIRCRSRFATRHLAVILTIVSVVMGLLPTAAIGKAVGAPKTILFGVVPALALLFGTLWYFVMHRAELSTRARYVGLVESIADLAVEHAERTRVAAGDEEARSAYEMAAVTDALAEEAHEVPAVRRYAED
jgi:hypothetical protein